MKYLWLLLLVAACDSEPPCNTDGPRVISTDEEGCKVYEVGVCPVYYTKCPPPAGSVVRTQWQECHQENRGKTTVTICEPRENGALQ